MGEASLAAQHVLRVLVWMLVAKEGPELGLDLHIGIMNLTLPQDIIRGPKDHFVLQTGS